MGQLFMVGSMVLLLAVVQPLTVGSLDKLLSDEHA
jgi:hypothetical protein